jgi:hypothetical protein
VSVGPLTYLAQAFVNADDAEVSNSYLDQVCENAPDSVECSMSTVVSQWSDENIDEVEATLNKAKKGSGYLEVWGVRHFMKQGQYREALALLDSLTSHREVAEFSLVQRVKALYDSYSESEAQVALAQALPSISPEEASDVSSWMCAQELQSGCDSLSKLACSHAGLEHTDIKEIDFEHTPEALSKVLALECRGASKMDYLSFGDSVQDSNWKSFFEANHKMQKGDKRGSFELFQDILDSKDAPDMLKVETIRRVAEIASTRQLSLVHEVWQRLESHEAWVRAGNILMSRFVKDRKSAKASALALSTAKDLMSSGALAPRWFSVVNDLSGSSINSRLPASVDDKDSDEDEESGD